MKKTQRIITFLACMLFITTHAAADQRVTICGTGDSQAMLRSLALAYEKQHPGVSIDVPDSNGSSGGIKATASGKCDLGRVARPLQENVMNLSKSNPTTRWVNWCNHLTT